MSASLQGYGRHGDGGWVERGAPTGAAVVPDRGAVVGHELKGPLGAVQTLSDMLLARMPADEDRHLVELIRLAGAQALAIADDLVAEAGLGADRFRVVAAPFDPASTLRTVAELWTPQFAGHKARLSLDLAEGLPAEIIGDESRVRQILFNLVSNAVKVTDGGVIRLSLAPTAEGVVFSVIDDGPGLAGGFEPEPFAAADPPRPGAGLGLWISGRIADALAGDLTVENAPGGGAVARLALPAVHPGAASPKAAARRPRSKAAPGSDRSARSPRGKAAEPAARAARGRPLLTGSRALVVDDSAISRLLLQAILESFDMTVDTAAGGDDAVAQAEANRPDLILLDWSLARETGADVLDRLEVALGGALPPVVSVSADARAMLGPRVAAHVVKPFTPRELHGALDLALSGVASTAVAG